MEDSQFESNYAGEFGSDFMLLEKARGNISNSSFTGLSLSSDLQEFQAGGGYISDTAVVNLLYTTVQGYYAFNGAGLLCLNHAQCTVKRSRFEQNEAFTYGGAIAHSS